MCKIIKRDGRIEDFNIDKLRRVTLWACNGKEVIANRLIAELQYSMSGTIRIQDLYDELIKIAVNNISAITHYYDEVAKKLLLLKLYKETWGLKRTGSYPHLRDVLIKGIEYKVYDKELGEFLLNSPYLDTINGYIVPDNDMLFNYKGLQLFFDKYCKKKAGSMLAKDTIELPQITYMTSAIQSCLPLYDLEDNEVFLEQVAISYKNLSLHRITYSTPRLTFGLRANPQFASCVLITPSDDIDGLNEADNHAALYSKNHGGIALDFSYIRARGSSISTNSGKSDGPIPFIKRLEQTVSSFNQGGTRSGAAIAYFNWWHLDVFDMINLKDAGGSEELRARKNKYAIKINRLLFERYRADDYITLFDPKEVPKLLDTYGDEFDKYYKEYESNGLLMTKKVKAKDLLFEMIRVRAETGNLYVFFTENVNEQNMLERYISMSNLCTEVTVPSRASKYDKHERLVYAENGEPIYITEKRTGEIGLCNLSSIDTLAWVDLSDQEKNDLILNLLTGMEYAINMQYYPAMQGRYSNIKYRPIGIGITDFANLLASKDIKFTDEEALHLMNEVMDDIYFRIYEQSCYLAEAIGPYNGFHKSNWSKGLTPLHMSRFAKENPFNLNIKWDKWNDLANRIAKTGVRFSLHAAIPPSATSGKVTNATEACEPVMDLFYIETGTHSLPTVVKCKQHFGSYQRCWDVPNKRINELAAIRQMYLDQAQSFNHYYKTLSSAKEILNDIMHAESLGIKTLYYLKSPKSNFEVECSSCSV